MVRPEIGSLVQWFPAQSLTGNRKEKHSSDQGWDLPSLQPRYGSRRRIVAYASHCTLPYGIRALSNNSLPSSEDARSGALRPVMTKSNPRHGSRLFLNGLSSKQKIAGLKCLGQKMRVGRMRACCRWRQCICGYMYVGLPVCQEAYMCSCFTPITTPGAIVCMHACPKLPRKK